MTTYAHGLTLAGDAPAEAMNKSLQQVQGALDRKPEKKVDLGGGKKDKDESSDEGGSGKGKQVIIHKLLVPVDLKKIKDLQQLLALLQEVEDYAAANEDGEPGDDEDAARPRHKEGGRYDLCRRRADQAQRRRPPRSRQKHRGH